jgi:hypothetical protein
MGIKPFLLWLPMIVIAFANAALRQLVFVKYFSDLRAHQLSTITLIILCSIYVWFVFPFLHIQNGKQAVLIGFVWVVLTVLFESLLGLLANRSWESVLQDYNLAAGRIWPIFLICLFLLPYIFYVVKNKKYRH